MLCYPSAGILVLRASSVSAGTPEAAAVPLCLGAGVSDAFVKPCEEQLLPSAAVAQDPPVWPLTPQPGGPVPRVCVQAEDTAVLFLFAGSASPHAELLSHKHVDK